MALLPIEHHKGIVDFASHSTNHWPGLTRTQIGIFCEQIVEAASVGVLLDRGVQSPALMIADHVNRKVVVLNLGDPGRSSIFPSKNPAAYVAGRKLEAKRAVELSQRQLQETLEKMKRLEEKLRRERELAELKRMEELKRQQEAAERKRKQEAEALKKKTEKLRREQELAEQKRKEELKRQQEAALKREMEKRAADEQKRRRAAFDAWMKEIERRRQMEIQMLHGMGRGR